MARPLKEGLDYFSLDCYMDSKVKMIQAEYGLKGFAIVVKLWQMIYREHGYYSEWNDEKALLFAYEECSDCGAGLLNEIVEACIRRGIFSEDLFRKYQILTSRGIQKRYLAVTDRRKKIGIKDEYLLVKVAPKQANETKTLLMHTETQVNACRNTQSKVNESKVNESRVENHTHIDNQSVCDTSSDTYKSLCSKYGKVFVDERVERAKKYSGTSMQTVAKWCEMDSKKQPAVKKTGFSNFNQREYDMDALEKALLEKNRVSDEEA